MKLNNYQRVVHQCFTNCIMEHAKDISMSASIYLLRVTYRQRDSGTRTQSGSTRRNICSFPSPNSSKELKKKKKSIGIH